MLLRSRWSLRRATQASIGTALDTFVHSQSVSANALMHFGILNTFFSAQRARRRKWILNPTRASEHLANAEHLAKNAFVLIFGRICVSYVWHISIRQNICQILEVLLFGENLNWIIQQNSYGIGSAIGTTRHSVIDTRGRLKTTPGGAELTRKLWTKILITTDTKVNEPRKTHLLD